MHIGRSRKRLHVRHVPWRRVNVIDIVSVPLQVTYIGSGLACHTWDARLSVWSPHFSSARLRYSPSPTACCLSRLICLMRHRCTILYRTHRAYTPTHRFPSRLAPVHTHLPSLPPSPPAAAASLPTTRAFHLSPAIAMPLKRKLPASIGYSTSDGLASNKRSALSTPAKATPSIKGTLSNPKIREESSLHKTESPRPGIKLSPSDPPQFDHSRVEERYGIVQRTFYPPQISNERCAMYNDGLIPRPIELLEQALADTKSARESIAAGDAVVHWFRRDLRLHDNRALSAASKKAAEKGVPLICMFIVSPQDYQAHLTSPARVDFELRTLQIMKRDLAELGIPLYVETVEKRKTIPGRILELCERWGVKHVFCNIEYEVDELRRDAALVRNALEKGAAFTALHDDVVVAPGALKTGAGKQYAVYSPWFRAWVAYLHKNTQLLEAFEPPGRNPESAKERFREILDMDIPAAPENKKLSDEEKERFEHLWPAGEHEALDRLKKFLGEKIGRYKDLRNFPGLNSTGMISVHHSAGTLAARTSVRMARDINSTKQLNSGNTGIAGWISEVAWRDFYKHVLAHWPYVW